MRDVDACGTEAGRLYLDLLKRVLTNTLHRTEPDRSRDDLDFALDFVEHYIRSDAVSMLSRRRLDSLQHCIELVISSDIPGDFIETGVWRGGATIFMRAMMKLLGVTDRLVWVADSFRGLPTPDPSTRPLEARIHRSHLMNEAYGHFSVDEDAVRRNFGAFGMLDEQVRFLSGWFKDTLPAAPIDRLALIRLDGDYYESTRDAVTHLWPRLSVGGIIIVDDYGEASWTYCRQAIDEFRESRRISAPIVEVDRMCMFWVKEE